MKRKFISVLLAGAMITSLTACGSNSGDTPATDNNNTGNTQNSAAPSTGDTTASGGYQLDKLVMVVDGTLTASKTLAD